MKVINVFKYKRYTFYSLVGITRKMQVKQDRYECNVRSIKSSRDFMEVAR